MCTNSGRPLPALYCATAVQTAMFAVLEMKRLTRWTLDISNFIIVKVRVIHSPINPSTAMIGSRTCWSFPRYVS